MADPYLTLGVRADAASEELRRAYRRLALRHHPDRNPGDSTSAERFQAVQEAYETLRDPRRRATYDLFYGRGQQRPASARAETPRPPRPAREPRPRRDPQPVRGLTQRAAASLAAAVAAIALDVVAAVHTFPAASPLGAESPSAGARPFLVAALVGLLLAAASWFAADEERRVLSHARAVRSHRLRGFAPNVPLPSPVSETIVGLTLQLARCAFFGALLAVVTALNA